MFFALEQTAIDTPHPFLRVSVVETICNHLPPGKPPCLFIALEELTWFRGGRVRQDFEPQDGRGYIDHRRCDFGATWHRRHPCTLTSGERRTAPRWCPSTDPMPDTYAEYFLDWRRTEAPQLEDAPFFLDTVRLLMDAVVTRPGMGTSPGPDRPIAPDGYEVEWELYSRGVRDLSVAEQHALPMEVRRYVPPNTAADTGPNAAFVEASFERGAAGVTGQCLLIRRYDSGWMDMWRYDEPLQAEGGADIYTMLRGRQHWDTALLVLWQWARTLERWPRRYGKFTVSSPMTPHWGDLRVSCWASISAPVDVPVRQTCRAFRRRAGLTGH